MRGHLSVLLRRQTKRNEIGVPWDDEILISVEELSERKNYRVVVEALQSLPESYWYVIVGQGDFAVEIKALDRAGRLLPLGYRSDVRELLRCSDLFVFPCLQEGLPVALMEAMAAGLPCVASDIKGNDDLISCRVDAKNPGKWAKAVLDGGVHGNADEFSSSVVRTRMNEIYREI